MKNFGLPVLGGGAGLRHEHFQAIIDTQPKFGWFEVISEEFAGKGGWARDCINLIAESYQLVGHSVGLSIGSTDPLDIKAIKKLKKFYQEIKSPWASDHLCFTMIDHANLNELIPLPFTMEAVNNTVERIKLIQNTLEIPFLIENVTRYITVSDREMSEVEFINRIIDSANCGLLLDLTNVYLNSIYHHFDPYQFVAQMPLARVGQIHLAGSTKNLDGTMIDSHNAPVMPEVWDLLKFTLGKTGPTSVLIEWDNDLPNLSQLLTEVATLDKIIQDYAA